MRKGVSERDVRGDGKRGEKDQKATTRKRNRSNLEGVDHRPLPGVGYCPLNSDSGFILDDFNNCIKPCPDHPVSREHNQVQLDIDYLQFCITLDDLQVNLDPW